MDFNLQNKVAVVYDNSLFQDIAVKLAEKFETVYYFTKWQDAFTKYNPLQVGSGLPNVIRAERFYDIKDRCDFFCFPDIGDGDLQEDLKREGRQVYGSGKTDAVEIKRTLFNSIKNGLGMNKIPCVEFDNIDDLREYLKDKENVFIKIDTFRGNMETMKWVGIKLCEPFLDKLQHELTLIKDGKIRITVEEPISDAIETGTDLICINGRYANKCLYGIERKGEAYLAVFSDYDKLPKPLKDINDQLAPFLESEQYCGSISTEVRIREKDKEGFFIDITCRAGNPPSACQMEIIKNIADAMYGASLGIVVPLESDYKYACQLQVYCDSAAHEHLYIDIPEEYKQFVKVKHWAKRKTEHGTVDVFVNTGDGVTSVLSVVGLGNTIDECIAMAKKIAPTIKAGASLEYNENALYDAKVELEKLYKLFPNSKI